MTPLSKTNSDRALGVTEKAQPTNLSPTDPKEQSLGGRPFRACPTPRSDQHHSFKTTADIQSANAKLQLVPLPSSTSPTPQSPTVRPQNLPAVQPLGLRVINILHSMIASRLRHFQAVWEMLSTDSWILQVIQGYQIPLLCNPIQLSHALQFAIFCVSSNPFYCTFQLQ